MTDSTVTLLNIIASYQEKKKEKPLLNEVKL